MYVDKEKAVFVFHTLHNAYLTKEYPYDLPDATPPQIKGNLPRNLVWGSREHACFLFVLCYWMRGGIDSRTACKSLTNVYYLNKKFFLPEFGSIIKLSAITLWLKASGLGFNAHNAAIAWKENWQKIAKEWDFDPRNLFRGISSYEEACQRIQRKGKRGFRGFQEKMVSMLIYFYMDAGMLDRWHFPIPIDFHVLRIIFSNEIIIAEVKDAKANGFYTKGMLQEVRNLFMWYCQNHGVDPITLCEAIWLYSRTMCSHHPGNISKVGGRQGRKTPVYAAKTWSKSQTRTFERTCGICYLAEFCRWCIPAAEYYIRGRLILRERRDTPRQKSLMQLTL